MSNRSNKDLTEEALALAALLRVEVQVDGLKNPQLVELVAKLNEDLPPLPADHKRPSVDEFVAKGYKADNYDAHMVSWENEIRRDLAAAAARAAAAEPPASPPVNGADTGTAGGPPFARPLDPPAPPARVEGAVTRVDGTSDGTLGGPPAPAAASALLPAQRYPFTVAEGKSITTKRGQLGAFQPVSADDFEGGAPQLAALVKAGFISDNAPKKA